MSSRNERGKETRNILTKGNNIVIKGLDWNNSQKKTRNIKELEKYEIKYS